MSDQSRSKAIGRGLLTCSVAALLMTLVKAAQPGEHQLRVRATDGTGALQTAEQRGIVPEGSTGYHQTTARVAA